MKLEFKQLLRNICSYTFIFAFLSCGGGGGGGSSASTDTAFSAQTWVSACFGLDSNNNGISLYDTKRTFSFALGFLTISDQYFDTIDGTCSGILQAEFDRIFTYQAFYDSPRRLSLTIQSFEFTPKAAGLASDFNDDDFCGITSGWAVDTVQDITGLTCDLDGAGGAEDLPTLHPPFNDRRYSRYEIISNSGTPSYDVLYIERLDQVLSISNITMPSTIDQPRMLFEPSQNFKEKFGFKATGPFFDDPLDSEYEQIDIGNSNSPCIRGAAANRVTDFILNDFDFEIITTYYEEFNDPEIDDAVEVGESVSCITPVSSRRWVYKSLKFPLMSSEITLPQYNLFVKEVWYTVHDPATVTSFNDHNGSVGVCDFNGWIQNTPFEITGLQCDFNRINGIEVEEGEIIESVGSLAFGVYDFNPSVPTDVFFGIPKALENERIINFLDPLNQPSYLRPK